MTDKPKWTPGPWAVGSRTNGYATSVVSATETQWRQSAGGKVPVMIVSMVARDKEHYGEMNANAHLIAAAPDMMETLIQAIEWWHSDTRRITAGEPDWLVGARAALQKAGAE